MRHEVSRLLRVPPPSLRTSIRPRDASDTQQATVVPSGHRGIGQPPTCMRVVFGGMYNPALHARCIGWYAVFVPFLFPTFSATSTAVNVLQKIKGFRFERSSAPFSILSVILLVLSTLRRLLAHSHLQLQLST